ncbi:winged helix-turn-helix domain-containing protein [Solihabitans fulvus]|uniref:winged helix-turn-helix domain-containing protein n=1 Tax=Solihabitans fulvus TaxID=1892852 RepID=UPI001CB76430|nr:winged helix-turn-helix domain-containing protein [Solihabitans fulvus]
MTRSERLERERLRLVAAELFSQEIPQAEIARMLGVSAQAVNHWHQTWTSGGREALLSTGPSGARSYLDEDQITQLRRALDQGPRQHGWDSDRWTLARIRRLIIELTGVTYRGVDGVWRLLHRMGWSCQLPQTPALERDEEAITAWRTQTWPQAKDPPATPGHGCVSRTRPGPR